MSLHTPETRQSTYPLKDHVTLHVSRALIEQEDLNDPERHRCQLSAQRIRQPS